MRTTTYPTTSPVLPALRGLLALAGGLVLFFALLLAIVTGYNFLYSGKIYPGVSVAGIDLSGLEPPEAAVLIGQRLDYPTRGQIAFQEGVNVWVANPKDLGLFLDPYASVTSAFQVGRSGDLPGRALAQLKAGYGGVDLPPMMVLDERMALGYLNGIAKQVNRPVIEANLEVNGLEIVALPGQIGRTLDVETALQELQDHLPSMTDGLIVLNVKETAPEIMDVSSQAEAARLILSKSLTLSMPDPEEGDPGPWAFEPEKLAQMLTIERVSDDGHPRYQVGLDGEGLRPFLEELAPTLLRYPQNARFIFNDETKQLEVIQDAITGRHLDVDATIQSINEKLAAGEHAVSLNIAYTSPEVPNNATAEQLGITELVSSHTSYFYGSGSSRIQNITTASSRFHGVLVPPGATFSMANVLGDVSLDNGYAEALIIFGDRTIQGVGGGVCQVSTTLFRTVFFGGFPVVERYPHAYRVGYYEQTASGGYDSRLAGLDATVFVPTVDFKFTNNTSYWLLMETYVNPSARTLTWKFYSTSDGRSVDWSTTGPRNVVEPPDPLYEENPELSEGEVRQVDYAAQGADISVSRTVQRNGEVLFEDTFNTHYLPWREVWQYGPGTEGMPPDQDDDHEDREED